MGFLKFVKFKKFLHNVIKTIWNNKLHLIDLSMSLKNFSEGLFSLNTCNVEKCKFFRHHFQNFSLRKNRYIDKMKAEYNLKIKQQNKSWRQKVSL